MGAAKEILQQAKQASGCTHAKLKMRALSLDEAAGLIVELKSSFCLRLDAPGTWDVRRLLARFDPSDYDYIEDPPDPAHFPFPFALDQALCRPLPEGVWRNPALRALVLKPTLLGRATERWAAVGRSRGLDVVLGSSFESGVGLSHIASLWKRLALPDVPLGLGTYAFLEQDVLRTPLTFQGGRLHFPQKIDVDDRQLARR
jgi:L-alanine-DL-glutamate epimerase-like enolase superfamily enzyme